MITSLQNHQVKAWKKLHQRKYRQQTRMFIIEGNHLVEEAITSDWQIEHIIVREDIEPSSSFTNNHVIWVSRDVFNHLSQTKTPQGIMAVVRMKEFSVIQGNQLLAIDAIQDPGNLGTIIRTADAAGYDGIILGKGTVDVFNDKVIRATQGSLFHIPFIQGRLQDYLKKLKREKFTIIASALRHAKHYQEIKNVNKFALLLGNEGSGVKKELIQLAHECVQIPIYGRAESLNVSVAAGILMYAFKK